MIAGGEVEVAHVITGIAGRVGGPVAFGARAFGAVARPGGCVQTLVQLAGA